MKISCSQDALLQATLLSERLVGKRESLPVLSCLLLEATKNELHIKATNLETGIDITVPAVIEREGTVAVPVQAFSNLIKIARSSSIELETDEENITIVTKQGTSTLKTVPSDEFPLIPRGESKKNQTLPTRVFLEGIQAVSYTASQSMIRPELASISISHIDGSVVFAATDSFRLAEKKIPSKIDTVFPEILIPAKNANELTHILTNVSEDTFEYGIDDSQISVSIGSVYFVSRLIDATFPNYQEIIPKKFETEATLLKSDLATILKKARIFSDTSQQIGLHIYPKDKTFTATARNGDVGEMADTIESAVSGENIDINFNLHYLFECLQSIHSDSVVLKFAGAGKPLVIQGVSDQTFMYLVMPMRI